MLEGSLAIVAGFSSGIGPGIARAFADHGADVLLMDGSGTQP